MPKKIVIEVNENSETTIDYLNFAGAECLAESQRLHDLLARQFGVQIETTGTTPKPELLLAQAAVPVQTPLQEYSLAVETEG